MNPSALSSTITVPAELTTRRICVFGISGSGKSNTATRCIEALLEAGEQIVLIDPKGEGWGLQTLAGGKKAGFNVVVFGQPSGDIPNLREEHAEQIADFVVESGRSVVLSLLGFVSDQAERRFVTNFFKQLYRRKTQQEPRTRTLVVLEEAHLFVPEQASGASGEMVGAIKRIARQGRTAGLGLMIVDQRPQDVAKSIISQAELLICHQLVHKLDRDALREWVRAYDDQGQGEAFLASLASLKPGEAWVWSPAWLHIFSREQIHRRRTFDSGATPDGTAAEVAPRVKASVDLAALRKHLEKVVTEAHENDPALLKKRVAELERALAERKVALPQPEIREVPTPVFTEDQMQALKAISETSQNATDTVNGMVETILAKFVKQTVFPKYPAKIPAARRQDPSVNGSAPRKAPDGSLGKAERSILTVLAQYSPAPVGRTRIALIANYSVDGGGFRNALGSLRGRALIEGSDPLTITSAGSEAIGDVPPLPTGPELLRHWQAELGKAEASILQALAAEPGGTLSREDVAAIAGYEPNGGGFRNALGRLRTLQLISGSNPLTLAEEL